MHFLLGPWLGLDELLLRTRFRDHSEETISAMLDVAEAISEERLAPYLRASDTQEPSLDEQGQVHVQPDVRRGAQAIAEAGIFGAVFDEQLGGLQLPHLVYVAAMGLLMSGSISTASFMLLTVANARLIANSGTAAQVGRFARPQIAGLSFGPMCLSEPQAGSSLGDIRTRAVSCGEDELGRRFRITGNKMWISGGDQDVTDNIVHLVLAKVPDETGSLVSGTGGISLFIVPKILPGGQANDVVVAGLNHKMGYRGLPNCALNFGEGRRTPDGAPGAIGWLVGELGQGLPLMFQMMNEARISVGVGAAMLAYRGYLMALDYARTRTQGRAMGVRGADPVPIIEYADVKRMLLAQKAYAEGALALVLYSARLLDDEATALDAGARRDAGDLLALLTPITKSWPSEWAQQSLGLAIQVHGGAGYTRDFEVELLYRDNRLNAIHEGTTGIQGIDLVGRKMRKNDGRALALLRQRIDATLATARAHPRLDTDAAAVERAWVAVEEAIARLLAESNDARAAMHATPFLFAFGHAVLGWLWLDQAALCARQLQEGLAGAERNHREGKLRACRFFADFELPKVNGWLAPIMSGTDVTATMPVEQFLGEIR
jgi:alkylation response protein AidB-like acyl-CoA dehydrogenase